MPLIALIGLTETFFVSASEHYFTNVNGYTLNA